MTRSYMTRSYMTEADDNLILQRVCYSGICCDNSTPSKGHSAIVPSVDMILGLDRSRCKGLIHAQLAYELRRVIHARDTHSLIFSAAVSKPYG